MTEATPLPRKHIRPTINNQIELESEIADVLSMSRRATPVNLPAVPNDLGRMSAEAVLAQYESAAKAVEAMGDDVKLRIKNLEAALIECDKDMKILSEAADMIREKGSRVKAQIEEASALSNDIRNACIDFKRKVGVE